MRRIGTVQVAAALLVFLGSGSLLLAEDKTETKATVEGEIVDMKCYLAMGMPGSGKHNKCAVKCAKMGIPVGVVEKETGKVYTLLAPAPGFAEHQGKTVRITGTLADKSMAIIPEKLEIKEGDDWKETKLPGGMM